MARRKRQDSLDRLVRLMERRLRRAGFTQCVDKLLVLEMVDVYLDGYRAALADVEDPSRVGSKL